MEPFRALAFDPGGSTGWATYWYNGSGRNDHWFQSGTIETKDHHSSIRHIIEEYAGPDDEYPSAHPATVITESFEYRQDSRRGLELISKEYIGVMRLICTDLCIPLIEQSPSNIEHYGKPLTGNKFMNYEKLKRLGQLHEPLRQNRHRHDALQHLVYWLAAKKGVEEIKEKIKRGT